MIQISVPHRALLIPYREDVARLIRHSKRAVIDGNDLLVLPHGNDESRLLNNLGVHVPPPIMYHYNWRNTKPFDTQRRTAAMLSMHKRAYVLNEMGTGKTRATLYAADYLMELNAVQRALIIAPLSTLQAVWANEIFLNFNHRGYAVAHGSREKRAKELERDVQFYIVNHDALHIIEPMLRKRKDIDLIIIDELAEFRTPNTRRWYALRDILATRPRAWGLTGTPTPNEPPDAWGQVNLLTPHMAPSTIGRLKDMTMIKVTDRRWIEKHTANATIHSIMQPAVRFKRTDCFDLPPVTTSARDAEMSAQQKKFYKDMLDHLLIEYKEHKITAANEGVKLGKLLQISAGYVYSSTDSTAVLSLVPEKKLAVLSEIISETERKVIVFVPFVHALKHVYDHVTKSTTAALVYGNTSKTERDKIFNDFQHAEHPRVLVAHPRTMSHGLTLTAANTIVWYSPTTSPGTYMQANARFTRAGQEFKQHIIHLQSSQIERRVFSRLASQEKMQGALLELFEASTLDKN